VKYRPVNRDYSKALPFARVRGIALHVDATMGRPLVAL
jgi:hypothetical protein